jgi:hypothetical protein
MINTPSLQKIMANAQRMGDNQTAELARSILDLDGYVPNTINDSITLSGTTMATTTTYLQFGVNVITTASLSANSAKLPYPPVKGKQVIVINNSGLPIQLFPSTEGGSINNSVNGVALIPSDGKAYTFYCWENPLPGAWSWTPPATNQYDSGVITFQPIALDTVFSPIAPGMVGYSTGFYSSTGTAIDPFNNPSFKFMSSGSGEGVYYFKPSPSWNQLTRIKVYTNLLYYNYPNVTFRLTTAYGYNYYLPGTTILKGYDGTGATQLTNDIEFETWVGGVAPTPALPVLTPNIGDNETMYVVHDLNLPAGLINSFGDTLVGQATKNGFLCDKYFSRYLSIQMQWRNVDLPGCQVRFFLEYN